MGYLTTHVLDLSRGHPAAGLRVALYRIEGEERLQLAAAITNADGRTESPILPPPAFRTGVYELVFHAGEYLGKRGGFLDLVPIRFGMEEERHYHVPLLLSAYGYSTYRGS